MPAFSKIAALASAAVLASSSRVGTSPVQKVIQMLSEMKTKGAAMFEEEKKTMATYDEWVHDQTQELNYEIETAQTTIESLLGDIEKAEATVAQLADEIRGLDGDTAQLEGDQKAATGIRGKANEEYVKVEEDLSESVDAIQRAIQVISSQQYDRPQSMMLLQKMAKTVPGMRHVLASLMEVSSQSNSEGAPAVAAYESQGAGLVDMLTDLLDKFKQQLSETTTEESNAAHAYDLQMLHLGNTIAKYKEDRREKGAAKGESAAASAKAQGDLADTKASLAEDQHFLSDMKATFAAKKATFAENQKVREQELEAIGKAIEIVSNPEVSASYSNRVKLVQTDAKGMVSLLQTESSKKSVALRQQVAAVLSQKASALSSSTLSALSAQVLNSPFDKVIKMIEGLLSKLKEEAAAEAEHKAYCDDELYKNKLKRNDKTAAVERLQATVEQQTGEITDMGTRIATLSKEQADLATAMASATEFRSSEKKENLAIIADSQAGNAAVKQALVILQEFYEAQGPAFVQQAPEMAAYKGQGGSGGGVIGMLQVIETDFSRLETDTKAAESQAANEYDSFMSDSKHSTKQKHKQEVQLKLDKDQTEFERSQTRKELSLEEEELAKANEYFQVLKPSCLQVHVSYEERVAKRKEEIAALNEAYSILDQQSA